MRPCLGFFLVFILAVPAVVLGMDVKVLGEIENKVVLSRTSPSEKTIILSDALKIYRVDTENSSMTLLSLTTEHIGSTQDIAFVSEDLVAVALSVRRTTSQGNSYTHSQIILHNLQTGENKIQDLGVLQVGQGGFVFFSPDGKAVMYRNYKGAKPSSYGVYQYQANLPTGWVFKKAFKTYNNSVHVNHPPFFWVTANKGVLLREFKKNEAGQWVPTLITENCFDFYTLSTNTEEETPRCKELDPNDGYRRGGPRSSDCSYSTDGKKYYIYGTENGVEIRVSDINDPLNLTFESVLQIDKDSDSYDWSLVCHPMQKNGFLVFSSQYDDTAIWKVDLEAKTSQLIKELPKDPLIFQRGLRPLRVSSADRLFYTFFADDPEQKMTKYVRVLKEDGTELDIIPPVQVERTRTDIPLVSLQEGSRVVWQENSLEKRSIKMASDVQFPWPSDGTDGNGSAGGPNTGDGSGSDSGSTPPPKDLPPLEDNNAVVDSGGGCSLILRK